MHAVDGLGLLRVGPGELREDHVGRDLEVDPDTGRCQRADDQRDVPVGRVVAAVLGDLAAGSVACSAIIARVAVSGPPASPARWWRRTIAGRRSGTEIVRTRTSVGPADVTLDIDI